MAEEVVSTPLRSHSNRRKIVACCDGTWNSEKFAAPLTNVSRIARCILPYYVQGVPQIVYYQDGVGTGTSKASNIVEGATGRGELRLLIFFHETDEPNVGARPLREY
jgi:hypothetical protein